MELQYLAGIMVTLFYLWILLSVLPFILIIILNIIILYPLALRSFSEVQKNQLEKYVFCGLISLIIIIRVFNQTQSELSGLIWPITWFFIVLAGVIILFETIDLNREKIFMVQQTIQQFVRRTIIK